MNLFYKKDKLHFGVRQPVNLSLFSKNKKTPFYLYDLKHVKCRYQVLHQCFEENFKVYYSLKANCNTSFLKLFRKLGSGVDVVSGGEIKLALQEGFSGEKIIFSGVGKTKEEIKLALFSSLKQINVESPQELIRIGEIAKAFSKEAPIAFRMNPQVHPESHPYIVTGFRENKFGMEPGLIPELKEILKKFKSHLKLKGLTIHIGSQLIQTKAFKAAIQKIKPLFQELKGDGFDMTSFDVGGGVGVFYEKGDEEEENNLIRSYADMIKKETSEFGCEILCEPGRWLVARSGVLITEIQYVKKSDFKNFVIVDTGMHHLLRPALYQSYHRILPLTQKNRTEGVRGGEEGQTFFDVVGPICESSDFIGKDRVLTSPSQGDLLAVADVGAYGYVMANHYNLHPFPKEYFLA